MDTLSAMVNASLSIEKLRVACQVRKAHLEKQGRHCVETEKLIEKLVDIEGYVDGRVAVLIKPHPAYEWFSRVKGVGKENIGKVVGQIRVKPEVRGNKELPYADTISALWKFSGWDVDEEGKAPKRIKGGGKLSYNSQLRSMCWRLATSLKRARGKFYKYYRKEKDKYTERFENQGYKILPTPTGKWSCLNCGANWGKKRDITPCCNNPSIEKKLRKEPLGVIWLGHLDAMAVRKMIKLFLGCLWLVWREAEGLPLTKPYAIGILGHKSYIDPWEMVD